MADLSDFSRFRHTQETIVDGHETFGMWNKPNWLMQKPADKDILVFKVNNRFEGRPDLISNQVYGTPLLAWAIVSFNAIYYDDAGARSGLNWPKTGTIVRYPSESIVFPEVI